MTTMVTDDDVRDGIHGVMRYLNRRVSDEALGWYVQDLGGKVSRPTFLAGLRHWMRSHPPTVSPPSVSDLWKIFQRHDAEEAKARAAQRAQHDPTTFERIAHVSNDPYIKAACQLMQRIGPMTTWSARGAAYRAFAAEHPTWAHQWLAIADDCDTLAAANDDTSVPVIRGRTPDFITERFARWQRAREAL